MCTDFCVCPGTPTDQHVKDYLALPDAVYDKANRTKTGFTGEINLVDFFDEKKKKPLFWSYKPATGETDPLLKELESDTIL